MSNEFSMQTKTFYTFVAIGICLLLVANYVSCEIPMLQKKITKDTLFRVQIVERPVYISDTIRIKSVMWKTKDSILFVESELPCSDTNFVAQADSVLLPSGDTLNMAFNYAQRTGNFSVVFKPRPDSVITKTIEVPIVHEKKVTDHGWTIGAFGLGILIGVIAAFSN